jgi:hypothetical protein
VTLEPRANQSQISSDLSVSDESSRGAPSLESMRWIHILNSFHLRRFRRVAHRLPICSRKPSIHGFHYPARRRRRSWCVDPQCSFHTWRMASACHEDTVASCRCLRLPCNTRSQLLQHLEIICFGCRLAVVCHVYTLPAELMLSFKFARTQEQLKSKK